MCFSSIDYKVNVPDIVFSNITIVTLQVPFCSGFEESNVLSIDGSGEEVTTVLCHASKEGIKTIKSFKLPDTLGGFYATFTEFLGFRAYLDEGKVKGLALTENLVKIYKIS